MSGEILIVDDEENIRTTLPPVLRAHGFKVTTAASVQDALALIMQYKFDVLIADLNIDTPGDGFTVVSAMRSTQPDALRLILTGYPAFETALEAIQQQVHDYLVKPTDTEVLVEKIRTWLGNTPKPTRQTQRKRLPRILRESQDSIAKNWLKLAKEDPVLASIPLTDAERARNQSALLDIVIGITEGEDINARDLKTAAEQGIVRLSKAIRCHCSFEPLVYLSMQLENRCSRIC